MNRILILTIFILLACSCKETAIKTSTSEHDVIQQNIINEEVKHKEIINHDDIVNYNKEELSTTTKSSNTPYYDADESLEKLINTDDSREMVYLLHPTKNMLVYCFHAIRSECHIEGVHNNKFFSYDISQVEGQNKGKLTAPGNPIESAKTFPIRWMTVNDEYAQVQMTSKIMMNSQQHTLHEPLVIKYKTGMMVR